MIGIYDLNDCSSLGFKDRLDIYKKCGFKEVALYLDSTYQTNNENYIDIIKYAKKIGLQILQVHIDWKISNLICDSTTNKYFEYISAKLTEAKDLGIKFVVAHSSQSNNPPTISNEQLEKFSTTISKFSNQNIYLCLETVRNNDNLDKILELNLEQVKVCYDLGHAHCYGNEKELFEKYKEKIVCSHLHNNYGKDTHEPLDQGEIDYKYFLDKLSNIPNSSNCLECFPPLGSNLTKEQFENFVSKCYDSVKNY